MIQGEERIQFQEKCVKSRLFLFIAIIFSGSAGADNEAQAILQASSGIWEGELYYLDYNSGQRFGIPMKVEANMTPDGATLMRKLTYTDPGTLVYAVSLISIDPESGEVVEAFFRDGNGEYFRSTIVETDFTAESAWKLVYLQAGTDDDRPASIRHTLQRDGNTLTSSKEVRYEGEDKFTLRNGTKVELAD